MSLRLSFLICKKRVIILIKKVSKVGVIITTIVQGWKSRIREDEGFFEGHTARKAQDQTVWGSDISP